MNIHMNELHLSCESGVCDTLLTIIQKTSATHNLGHFYQHPSSWRFEKRKHPISVATMKLDFDASCDWNGPSPFWNPTHCVANCNKSMTMKIKMLFDFSAFACFIDKKLVHQFKLPLYTYTIFSSGSSNPWKPQGPINLYFLHGGQVISGTTCHLSYH
jgi:hypothetical protein